MDLIDHLREVPSYLADRRHRWLDGAQVHGLKFRD
jgi:hypothetical protein